MRNCLLKMGQDGPCVLGPVRPINLLLFIYSHNELCFFLEQCLFIKSCLFYKMLCLFLNSCKYSSYIFSEQVCLFHLLLFWSQLFSMILSLICISQEKERNSSYVSWARRLLVLLLCAIDHCILRDTMSKGLKAPLR